MPSRIKSNDRTYAKFASHLATWALGQRAFHDLVIHPLMALTNYWDPLVRLHDYHAFKSAAAGEPLIGIMGTREDVEATFAALDIEIEHIHADGVLACGMGTPKQKPRKSPECRICGGRGFVHHWIPGHGSEPARRVERPCSSCKDLS